MAYKVDSKYEIELQKGHEDDDESGDVVFWVEVFLHKIPRTDFSVSMKYSYFSSAEMELKYEGVNSQEGAEKMFFDIFSKILKWINITPQ